MPRKFFRRWLPHPGRNSDSKGLRWLGPLVNDPNLFHLNRQSVSRAFFVGLFCAFLPIPGQTIVAALMALALRCNLPLSLALIWITNPLTMTPIFVGSYQLGAWILDTPPASFRIELSWEWFTNLRSNIYQPLLLGSLVAGTIAGSIGYLVVHEIWRWTVIKNWGIRKEKRARDKRLREQRKRR